MDPLTLMFMAAGQQQPGMQNMLNPGGGVPSVPVTMPQAPAQPSPMAAAGPAAVTPPAGQPGSSSLGEMLSGIKAPAAEAPKFSGGVSGSGLPYVSRIEDMLSPFLAATKPGAVGSLPSLGQLLSQAPGGGR